MSSSVGGREGAPTHKGAIPKAVDSRAGASERPSAANAAATLKQAVKDTRSALVSATEDRLALSALLGAAPLVILVSDQKGYITHATGNVQAILGYPPAELKGRPLTQLLAPEGCDHFEGSVRSLLQRQQVAAEKVAAAARAGKPPAPLAESGAGVTNTWTAASVGLVDEDMRFPALLLKRDGATRVASEVMMRASRRAPDGQLEIIFYARPVPPGGVFGTPTAPFAWPPVSSAPVSAPAPMASASATTAVSSSAAPAPAFAESPESSSTLPPEHEDEASSTGVPAATTTTTTTTHVLLPPPFLVDPVKAHQAALGQLPGGVRGGAGASSVTPIPGAHQALAHLYMVTAAEAVATEYLTALQSVDPFSSSFEGPSSSSAAPSATAAVAAGLSASQFAIPPVSSSSFGGAGAGGGRIPAGIFPPVPNVYYAPAGPIGLRSTSGRQAAKKQPASTVPVAVPTSKPVSSKRPSSGGAGGPGVGAAASSSFSSSAPSIGGLASIPSVFPAGGVRPSGRAGDGGSGSGGLMAHQDTMTLDAAGILLNAANSLEMEEDVQQQSTAEDEYPEEERRGSHRHGQAPGGRR